ncbi:MAG: hypothetical protein PHQ65_13825 [Bacteroidales bacterium]|nr:hypothetical protein [Bacteroidales bacterium]MDD3666338.1 hypothetical protein [Bacteroidales bacterium]
MSLQNLIQIEIPEQLAQEINTNLGEVENKLAPFMIALTPAQRQEYGRLGNHFRPWVDKVAVHMAQRPDLVPNFVSKNEYDADKAAIDVLLPMLARVEALKVALEDTIKLIGSDLYTNSVAYYRNIKLLAAQNVTGAKPIYDDLSYAFPTRTKKQPDPQANNG